MRAGLAQREVVLAGVALLAAVFGLAVAGARDGEADRQADPAAVPAPGTDWYTALAAPYRFGPKEKRTACGHRAGPKLLGVAHPVLPCGAKIFVQFGETRVLTQVVDRGTGVPGREFDVTEPLARRIGLRGIKPIRWRFAARP